MSDIRSFLELKTRALHRAVDSGAAGFDLTNPAGFEEFLIFMWRGCAPVECGLSRFGAATVLAEWPERTRAERLRKEIAGFPEKSRTSVTFTGEPEVWGALYVLEGSRLGTKALSRTTPLAADSVFFQEAKTCRFWPDFVARLELADSRLNDRDGMAVGARKAFQAFLGKGDG